MKRTCSENSTLRFSLDTELKFWVGSQCLSLISWRNVDKSKERVKVSREAQKNATKYQIAALAFVTNDLKPHLSSSCSSLGNINISCENLLFFKKRKKRSFWPLTCYYLTFTISLLISIVSLCIIKAGWQLFFKPDCPYIKSFVPSLCVAEFCREHHEWAAGLVRLWQGGAERLWQPGNRGDTTAHLCPQRYTALVENMIRSCFMIWSYRHVVSVLTGKPYYGAISRFLYLLLSLLDFGAI